MLNNDMNHIPEWDKFYIKSSHFSKLKEDISVLIRESSKKDRKIYVKVNNPYQSSLLFYDLKDNEIIIYLSSINQRLHQFEEGLMVQIDLISFFIKEYLHFYQLRLKQLQRHVDYLKIVIEVNQNRKSKKEKEKKRKLKQGQIKFNDRNADEINGINEINDDISELTNLSEYLLEEGEEDDRKIIYFSNEKYVEYMNIYELVFKEMHKECFYLIRFLNQNIFIFNNMSKTYSKVVNDLFEVIGKYENSNNFDENHDFYMKKVSLSHEHSFDYSKSSNFNLNISNPSPNFNKLSQVTQSNQSKNQEKHEFFNKIKSDYKDLLTKNEEKSKLLSFLTSLDQIKDEIESLYEKKFSYKYSSQEAALEILKTNSDFSNFSLFQIFTFGFLIGCIMFVVILEVYLGSYFGFEFEYNKNFKSVFPLFRGFFLICFLLWMLGFNVLIWERNYINYRLCFRFTNGSSSLYSIFNRAAVFSFISLFMLFAYILSRRYEIVTVFSNFKDHSNKYITQNFTLFNDLFPLICYGLLLIYLVFPSTQAYNLMNYNGRKFFLLVLLECLLSPVYFLIDFFYFIVNLFVNSLRITSTHTLHELSFYSILSYLVLISKNTNEFKHIWVTDLLTSFIGPIRDLEYTLCYCYYYNSDVLEKQEYCHPERIIVLVVGILPHILRIFQCLRVIVNTKTVFPQIINAGKYFFAIVAATLAFYYKKDESLFGYWLIIALVSTIYSSYWDIKYDFGFLEEGEEYPLRKYLSYNSKWVYYFIVFINFFLRFGWILTTSPELMSRFLYPEFSAGLIYLLEILRRAMWNFIRVEYEHVKLCQNFKVSIDIELPLRIVKSESKGKYSYDVYDVYDNEKVIIDNDEVERKERIGKGGNQSKAYKTLTSNLIKNMKNIENIDYEKEDNLKRDNEITDMKERIISMRKSIKRKLSSRRSVNDLKFFDGFHQKLKISLKNEEKEGKEDENDENDMSVNDLRQKVKDYIFNN